MTYQLKHFRRSPLALATLAACLGIGAAQAADPTAARTVTVAYGDLNLATEAGANVLYARLTAAARTVCAAAGVDARNLRQYAAVRSCERQAIAAAVQDVQAPKVAARFAALHAPG
ncbi:MAG TPA: UrcA family protein [Steroidobacteraceae bacterium]|nr:UrcA family protein [Steroidobacteraceae bacterium]